MGTIELLNVTLGRAGPNEGQSAALRPALAGRGGQSRKNTDCRRKSVIPVFMVVSLQPCVMAAGFHVYTALAVVPGLHIRWDTDGQGSRCRAMTCVLLRRCATKGNPSSTSKMMGNLLLRESRALKKLKAKPRYVPSPVGRILCAGYCPWPQVRSDLNVWRIVETIFT